MFRSPVHVRDAVPDDAAALVEIWSGFGDRPAERGADLDSDGPALREAVSSAARIAADPDERLLVAVIDGQVVGATHLARGQLSPIHVESAVYVMHLQVLEDHRRHGVGRALLEATVTWAEEKDTSHVVVAAAVALPRRQPLHGPAGARADRRRARCDRAGAAGQASRRAAGGRPGRQPPPPQRRPGAGPTTLDAAGPHPRLLAGTGPPGVGVVRTRVAHVSDQPVPPAEPSVDLSEPTGPPPRLLLLDGHSLAYRAFFALPVENFSTTTGQHTNAVYGFTSMLINVLRDEQPTHVAVAFDVSRQTFRSEEYAELQGQPLQVARRVQRPGRR